MSEIKDTVKVSLNCTVIAGINKEDGAMAYTVFPRYQAWKATDSEIAVADNFPITMELPYLSEDDLRAKAVETLRAKLARIQAEAYVASMELQAKIDSMLNLGYYPTDGSF